jgi:hypothetical protein
VPGRLAKGLAAASVGPELIRGMTSVSRLAPLLGLAVLGACATVPTGPAVMVLPGTGKSFDAFRADDAVCRQFAHEQVGGLTPQQAASNTAATGAVVGTAVGAAAGALIGGTASATGVGAGAGLLVGSLAGAGAGTGSYYNAQMRYDFGYQQCMYAKGNRIPVSGRFASSLPPRQAYYPPPPPNAPPPPAR